MRLLLAFPLMRLPFAAYAALVSGPGGTAALEAGWLSLPLLSGGTAMLTAADGLMAFTLAVLFLEVVKATRLGFAPIADHVLSVLVVIGFVVAFLAWAPAATGLFALLTLAALVDVLAGLWISLNVARRDVAIAPGGSF